MEGSIISFVSLDDDRLCAYIERCRKVPAERTVTHGYSVSGFHSHRHSGGGDILSVAAHGYWGQTMILLTFALVVWAIVAVSLGAAYAMWILWSIGGGR